MESSPAAATAIPGVVDAAAALTPLDALAVPLAEPMLEALKKNGFDPLFPIQACQAMFFFDKSARNAQVWKWDPLVHRMKSLTTRLF